MSHSPSLSFQLSLLKDISQSTEPNIIFSPLSIYQALSLTSNGAKGETQIQILTTIEHSTQQEANTSNFKILENKKQCLQIANAILSLFDPEQPFIDISKKYNALASKLISVDQVNQWCADNTNNKIRKIIDDINQIQMIILNAVYFKSEWVERFQEKATSIKSFYNKDGSISKVKMMKQQKHFLYFENDNIQSIQMNYKDKGLSAIIILPKKHIDIRDYINNLNDSEFNDIVSKMTSEKVVIELPRFEFDFKTSLKETLMKMGMNFPFCKDKADFGNLYSKGKLYIDNVIHKAYLKVDENGSEAAAVTAVMMKMMCAGPMRGVLKQMIVERPFLFVIRDADIKDKMLFIAKVEKIDSVE